MLPAQDGMVVSTTDPEALAMRKSVIEWLMINHPHDCPVCDEGGECQLQDFTIACGQSIRRYDGRKRTHVNQDLGPYIAHEMNRCIQCYRCVRFYQEFAGGSDFGVMGSAGRVYFGRAGDGALESPFSGNLVDICPTGVFTDKTARFRARYWDYDMAPSICPVCSAGCNTVPVAHYRELIKVTARHNDRVNGWFICDRGRFAEKIVNAWQRPRSAMVDGVDSTWDAALEALCRRVAGMPVGSIALVGSARLSLEGSLLLAQLASVLPAGSLSWFLREEEAAAADAAVSGLTAANAASMQDVADADCIVIHECDLREEAPMLLLAVRQAWRKGAPVLLVGEGAPLEQTQSVSVEAIRIDYIEEAPVGIFDRAVIIFSTVANGSAEIGNLLHAGTKFAPLFSGPNGCGAALLARTHGAVSLEAAVATGRINGIIAVEAEIPEELAAGIPVIAALDWQRTEADGRAEILLPTRAWCEMDGTFINYEGRAQRFRRVMHPGVPLDAELENGHPPRIHRRAASGTDAQEAWRAIAVLLACLGAGIPPDPLTGEWSGLHDLDPEGAGVSVLP
jgi:NADH-quinone oxidoreductase subunit G